MGESDKHGAAGRMAVLDLMAGADKAILEDDLFSAAGLMWKAVETTFRNMAEEKGLDWKDLRKMAGELEREDSDRRSRLTINILMAEALRDHCMVDPIERYELEEDVLESFLEGTREFVMNQHGKFS